MEVSPSDIKLGVPGSSTLCPIALALWWRIPGHKEVHEDGTVTIHPLIFEVRSCRSMRWRYHKQVPDMSKELGRFMLPPEAVLWMKGFDETGKAQPACFTVEIPNLKGGETDDNEHQEDPGRPRGL